MIFQGHTSSKVIHTFSLRLTLASGLTFILAHAQPDNFFLSEFMDPTLSEVDDTSWNSDGLISGLPDFASNQVNQDETDLFPNSDDHVDGTNLWDLASISDSCGIEESSTNDLLPVRDGTSCASQEGKVDLPIELFQDPEGYLRQTLRAPPAGQADQSGQGNKEDGDLGFGAFIRNRFPPISRPLASDDESCDRGKFGVPTTPLCSNPFTGSVNKDMTAGNSFTLTDAVPCRCLFHFFFRFFFCLLILSEDVVELGCPEPSELWCCVITRIRARNFLEIDPSLVWVFLSATLFIV